MRKSQRRGSPFQFCRRAFLIFVCLLPQGSVTGGPGLQRISWLVLGSVEGAPISYHQLSEKEDICILSVLHYCTTTSKRVRLI